MNTVKKLLPIIKLALLVGLCFYIVPSSLLFLYLHLSFYDPIYFYGVAIQLLAVNTVFLLNLFLTLKPLLLPNRKDVHNANDRRAAVVCSLLGGIMFLCLALRSEAIYDWFFVFCNGAIILLSVYELLHPNTQ